MPRAEGWPTALICCFAYLIFVINVQKIPGKTGYSWCYVLKSLLNLSINCGLQYTLKTRETPAAKPALSLGCLYESVPRLAALQLEAQGPTVPH